MVHLKVTKVQRQSEGGVVVHLACLQAWTFWIQAWNKKDTYLENFVPNVSIHAEFFGFQGPTSGQKRTISSSSQNSEEQGTKTAEETRYELLLKQQQLYLQWQIATQDKVNKWCPVCRFQKTPEREFLEKKRIVFKPPTPREKPVANFPPLHAYSQKYYATQNKVVCRVQESYETLARFQYSLGNLRSALKVWKGEIWCLRFQKFSEGGKKLEKTLTFPSSWENSWFFLDQIQSNSI